MAKTIQLTQDQVAIVDDDDFDWLSEFTWYADWVPCIQGFYASRQVRTGLERPKQRQFRMHQAIWLRYNGPVPKGFTIDHADRVTLNDRLSNLRLATRSQQRLNQGLSSRNTSGYRGVCWYPKYGKWVARIRVDGKNIHLGYFTDLIEGAHAYDAAARIHLDLDFAQLNFPR